MNLIHLAPVIVPLLLGSCARDGFDPMASSDPWLTVVDFDAALDPCPSGWTLIEVVPTCTRDIYDAQPPTHPALSAFFAVPRAYRMVRGYLVGCQSGSTDGFTSSSYGDGSIESVYVDGVSITHGNPRQHIWTFAVGLTEDLESNGDCPCRGGASPPAWLGNDYFCESANRGQWEYGHWYVDDPLWDADSTNGECRAQATPAWFYQTLAEETSDPIEVRIMANHNSFDEDVGINRMVIEIH